jgi:hypothetical protein
VVVDGVLLVVGYVVGGYVVVDGVLLVVGYVVGG